MGLTALITGASSGIGDAYAQVFAENGYDLVITGRNPLPLHRLASRLQEKHNVAVKVVVKDLAHLEQVYSLYDETISEQIDVVVNNAGFGQYGYFYNTDLQTELDMITVNVSAVTILTKLYLQLMVRRNFGTIINVSSTAAFQPVPLMNVYGATKSYVLSLTEAIASELEGTAVHVMAVCPGSTESNFHKRAGSERSSKDRTQLMTARQVADITYDAMLKRKRIVIPGFTNQFVAQAHRFLPRHVLSRMAKQMYLRRKR
ncbi:SDR family NAD(P)-dependent oxidoreductase [Alicyclobacillus ferrooxydans]|uniref:Short-chain dehydrogenase n=1 Tax=Alicyclobacillus ferrooxydans TaxID=471514 RepID=A0A0P9CKM7_9BACL|nr:SDR family oxidoreductase [Alicyclobacillus ferrooxydans]KPV43566.1 hypothetical protein AN477_11740 [Alicyclobacillus ferrooxydans]